MKHTDIETELANELKARKVRRQECDIDYTYGAKPTVKDSSNIDVGKFTASLDSMTKVEEDNLTRYTSRVDIEFSTPLPLRVKIPSYKARKRNKLAAFKRRLSSLGVVDTSTCELPQIEFKEIGL